MKKFKLAQPHWQRPGVTRAPASCGKNCRACFGGEIGFVLVANWDVVAKKKLPEWLPPCGRCRQEFVSGSLHLLAGETHLERRLLLVGACDNDSLMRDEAEGDDTGKPKIEGQGDGLGDSLKLRGSQRAGGEHLVERVLFEANRRCRPDSGRNPRAGAEDESCGDTDEKGEHHDDDVDQDASPPARLLRCGFHERRRTINQPSLATTATRRPDGRCAGPPPLAGAQVERSRFAGMTWERGVG